jgi:hypothetical protein
MHAEAIQCQIREIESLILSRLPAMDAVKPAVTLVRAALAVMHSLEEDGLLPDPLPGLSLSSLAHLANGPPAGDAA